MDRESLVLRNKSMAEAFHSVPLRHRLRSLLLQAISTTPIIKQRANTDRILIIRPDHLGDMLLTTPAIHALRQAYPNTEIHALVGSWSAQILANYPEIDTVLTLPFPGFSRTPNTNLRSPYQLAFSSARKLRKIGYKTAVIMRPDHWWGAMLAFMAGIPTRIGYDLPNVSPFLTHKITHEHEHVVLQNAKLIQAIDPQIDISEKALRFHYPIMDTSRAWIKGYLIEWGIEAHTNIIAIHPGAGTWVKQWDAEKWASVADHLADQFDAQIVFTGGDHETILAQNIAAHMEHQPCFTAGDTDIGTLAALFERAQIVLGADSGPLHLAAAVGTPTVALFGAADPIEFGTWGKANKHRVLYSDIACRPCRVLDWGTDAPEYHPCVREISVARVLDAARQAINS